VRISSWVKEKPPTASLLRGKSPWHGHKPPMRCLSCQAADGSVSTRGPDAHASLLRSARARALLTKQRRALPRDPMEEPG